MNPDGPTPIIDRAERDEALDRLRTVLAETYVDRDTARRMADDLGERAANGEYQALDDPAALAERWTEDLRRISRDLHLKVRYRPEGIPAGEPGERAEEAGFRRSAAARNNGFVRAERLDGNVGRVRLDAFLAPAIAGETASAAMTFVADTDALIVDLRRNNGGSPAMVARLTAYLFGPEPVHLNDIHWRPTGETQSFRTPAQVPGRRFGPHKPVHVLTSARTFSGGEEFAYNLQALKRATIVGETTCGAAHPGGFVRLSGHFSAYIPTGRPVNPVTKTNWEGTGVIPDVAVPATDALRTAHILALQHLLEADAPPWLLEERRKALARLRGSEPRRGE